MASFVDFAPALLAFAGGVGAGLFFARCRRETPVKIPARPESTVETPFRGQGVAALAETLREVVLILDKDDRLVFFNAAARNLPGVDEKSLGRDAAVLVRSADFLEHLRRVRAGKRYDGPAEVLIRRTPAAGDLSLEAGFAMLPESAGFGAGALAVVMSDVSRLRRLENLRREFVANVSHDLRTPVTIVKGYAQALVEDYAGMSDEDRLRFLEKIQRNANRLHLLLEDLLELSSLEGDGPATLHCVAGVLHETLRDAAEALEDRFNSAGITVGFDFVPDDSRVEVDAPKLFRVMQNLLENVLRYAAGATRVRIATRIAGDRFEVRVEDDGPGLAQAEHEKVFERFYRAEKSRSVAGGGSGLGLSIVKHIVLAHGGRVRSEPAGSRGFVVVIDLPLLPA